VALSFPTIQNNQTELSKIIISIENESKAKVNVTAKFINEQKTSLYNQTLLLDPYLSINIDCKPGFYNLSLYVDQLRQIQRTVQVWSITTNVGYIVLDDQIKETSGGP
jgi:hypothetical protein